VTSPCRRRRSWPRCMVAEAIKANPGKSDRTLAAEIGVTQPTVSKARKELSATDNSLSVDARTGLDGKRGGCRTRR
jgi:hypothetical protein